MKSLWKEQNLQSYFLVSKDNISQCIYILREKIKIHAWNIAVFVTLNWKVEYFMHVTDLYMNMSL